MTVATQIAQQNVQLDFILCIEGVAWPSNLADLSALWWGNFFATTDLNGTLEADLSNTTSNQAAGGNMHFGLKLPGGVSEEFDPRSLKFSPGSLSFDIIDHDDWLRTKITPELTTGVTDKLYEDIGYEDTTIQIDNATNTFAASDLIWVADSELIKLGSVSGGGSVKTYTNSVRGYLGTPIGRIDDNPLSVSAFAWLGSNTGNGIASNIRTWLRRWYNKRVLLFAKVPGEARENAVLLYKGRIRTISTTRGGIGYQFNTTSDMMGGTGRVRREPPAVTITEDEFVDPKTGSHLFGGQHQGGSAGSGIYEPRMSILDYQVHSMAHRVRVSLPTEPAYAHYSLAYAYQYRQYVAGGTSGVKSAIDADPTAPQAYTEPGSLAREIMGGLVSVNGNVLLAMYKMVGSERDYRDILVQAANWDTGTITTNAFEAGAEMKFLLDNVTDSKSRSRWVINNAITRNAVDVLLAFLTSTNNEYFIHTNATTIGAVTLADGRAAHRVTFGATTPTFTTDEWAGFALFCVTGNNKGEMREIVANGADTIDVVPPFPSTTSTGQYQIRNTIYDILPLGWGVGISNKEIDVSSFEAVRDKYLESADLGRFAIGDSGDINIWDLVLDNICAPYGILLYPDRFTGKLSARYIGDRAVADGVDETYPTIGTSQILEVGEIDYLPRSQISAIKLKVRDSKTVSVRPVQVTSYAERTVAAARGTSGYLEDRVSSVGDDGATIDITIQDDTGDMVFQNDLTETLEYSAMLHDKDGSVDLAQRMISRLARERIPDPEITMKFDLSLISTMQPGAIFSITENTKFKPTNPFSGTRGWTSVLCLVRSITYSLDGANPGIEARLIILTDSASGRIAPAAYVVGKGNDGGGHYFTVRAAGASDYAADVNTLDWALFAVADRIEVRDSTGAADATGIGGALVGTIKGFGSNLSTTPAGASDDRIYLNETIGHTVVAGDYITFTAYSTASNTTNMNAHIAYADAAETVDADAADKYA